jgi:very-short-patch-repair endonuclease
MSRKPTTFDVQNAISEYLAGEGIFIVAPRNHISQRRLSKILKDRRLFRDSSTRYKLATEKSSATRREKAGLPVDQIVARYKAGESENGLAKAFTTNRNVIHARLVAAGVNLRSNAAANRLLAEQTPREEHMRRIRIAQKATRGKKRTFEHGCNIALSRQNNSSGRSEYEILISDMLISRGIDVIPQQAVGPYNIDIGTYPIAVEILGGNWHNIKKIHLKRTRYILNQNWLMVFIWSTKRAPISASVTDYIITCLQEVRHDPSILGEYRVIRGDGQELARQRFDPDNFTIVVPGYEGYGRA